MNVSQSTPARILVFRNGQIGNTVAALPFLKCLRKHWPQAQIDCIVDDLSGAVLENCSDINNRILYNRHQATLGESVTLIRRLRQTNYQMCFLLKRFFRNELLAYLSGIPQRIGFRTSGKRPFALTREVPYSENCHITDTNLSLLRALSIPTPDKIPHFNTSTLDRSEFRKLIRNSRWASKAAVIHTQATTQARDKVSQKVFVNTAEKLYHAFAMPTVALFGPGEDAQARQFESDCETPCLTLQGASLATVLAALEEAPIFIGHDSGPAHLAAAMQVPQIVIYNDRPDLESHLTKWRPLNARLKTLVKNKLDDAQLFEAVKSLLNTGSNRDKSTS